MYLKPNVKRWGPAQLSPAEGKYFIEEQLWQSAASVKEHISFFDEV